MTEPLDSKSNEELPVAPVSGDITTFQQREEQVQLVLELTQTGTWDWHIPTGLLNWNPSLYTLLGFSPGEYEPSFEIWRRRIHPDDLTGVEQKLTSALANHTDYEALYRFIYPDGSIRWLLGKGRGIYDEAGQPIRMVGTLIDITERKQTEEALRCSEARFRQVVENIGEVFWIVS